VPPREVGPGILVPMDTTGALPATSLHSVVRGGEVLGDGNRPQVRDVNAAAV
jgi:hypothetical protein